LVQSNFTTSIHHTNFILREVRAGGRGGALYAGSDAFFAKGLRISNATAEQGGGAYVNGNLFVEGKSTMERCHATSVAGGMLVKASMQLQAASFRGCSAHEEVFKVHGTAHIDDIEVSCGEKVRGVAGALHIQTANCSLSAECSWEVTEGTPARVEELTCAPGEGDVHGQCKRCQEGFTKLTWDARSCLSCAIIPNVTLQCTPTTLAVPAGFTVRFDQSANSFSDWSHCPNELACPGGQLRASAAPGQPTQVVKEMCAPGYFGNGCTKCSDKYAHADTNILQCIKCASAQEAVTVQYVVVYLVKNLALFGSAAASVSGATRERADSTTLLNQVMAFAAVAGIAMSAAMQTATFRDLHESTQALLSSLSVPIDLAHGQTSGAKMSGECLLALLGQPQTPQHTHLLMTVWPAILVVGLAFWKGGWLAGVVGTNVFLPAFVADFGKYLVVFRLRPESSIGGGGERHWNFLPEEPYFAPMLAAVLASITACFTLGVCSWAYIVQRRSEPLEPHVAYLTQAYKAECSVWETERLVRKMLLQLITAMLPVTLSPALQLQGVSVVLMTSFWLHLRYQPYKADSFNRSEMALLFVALGMIGLTTCLLANDLHWAHSAATQKLLIFLICFLAAGICCGMMVRFAMAFFAEKRAEREAAGPKDGPQESSD